MAKQEETGPVLTEGEVDLLAPEVKRRFHGDGPGGKTARYDGLPNEEEKRIILSSLTASATKAQKQCQGFASAIAIPSMRRGWVMRVRHYMGGKYYRCLAYQGYCPACVAEELTDREKSPSDAYINNVIVFHTDVKGFPTRVPNIEWHPAFTILGGTKVEAFKSTVAKYDNNPAGIVFGVTLENPEFKAWKTEPWPDRSDFVKAVMKEMVLALPDDTLDWRPEVLERVEKEGLNRKAFEKFLCNEITAAEMIQKFALQSQQAKLKELTKGAKSVVDTGSSVANKAAKEEASKRVREEPPALDDGSSILTEGTPVEDESDTGGLGGVMDEL